MNWYSVHLIEHIRLVSYNILVLAWACMRGRFRIEIDTTTRLSYFEFRFFLTKNRIFFIFFIIIRVEFIFNAINCRFFSFFSFILFLFFTVFTPSDSFFNLQLFFFESFSPWWKLSISMKMRKCLNSRAKQSKENQWIFLLVCTSLKWAFPTHWFLASEELLNDVFLIRVGRWIGMKWN